MYPVIPTYKVRTLESQLSEDTGVPEINPSGASLIARALCPAAESTRMGRSFYALQATATAPVAALPTTAARFALWNGEPDGGKIYVIESVFAICVAAGASNTVSVVGQLNLGRKANPGTTSVTIRSRSGRIYRGFASARVTLTVTNDAAWQPLGNAVVVPGGVTSLSVTHYIGGKIVVPPGHIFGISSLMQDTASSTTRIGISWTEVLLPAGPAGGM